MTLYRFFRLLQTLLYVLEGTVFVYAVMSWIRAPYGFFKWLENIVTPILAPFKALNDLLLGRFNLPIDFSCLIAIFAFQIANSMLWRLYLILRTIRGR